MENLFRNEMMMKIAGVEILLRPTFENLAAMESKMGSIAYLAFKYGAKIDLKNPDPKEMIKCAPPVTDTAMIIYYNQAVHKYTLDEILDLVLTEGSLQVGMQIIPFLLRMSAGNKNIPQATEEEKKS